MRQIALVVIGDELLDGRIRDVNAAELGRTCRERGGQLIRILTVADEAAAVADAIREAARILPDEGVIITSGGLGPTLDDATREGIARAVDEPLIEDPAAVARVEKKYGARGRTLEAAGRRQALRPGSATWLPSDVGTADGLRLFVRGRLLLALPGVPREFRHLIREYVVPLLEGSSRTHFRRVWLFGIGESDVATLLEGESAALNGAGISYCARYPVIELELRHAAPAALRESWARVETMLAPWMLPEGAESPEQALAKSLSERGLTITCAESCTGGLLASRLTDVPGASGWLGRTWVTYADDAKMEELGVPPEALAACGAVSDEVVRAMALGARRRAGADLAVAISGIAGPTGGSADKPVGRVHMAVADAQGVDVLVAEFPGMDRRTFKRQAAATAALFALRKVDGRLGMLKAMYGVRSLR